MPELPEVEAARRAAHKVAIGRRIIEAHVADDPIVFEGVAPARFRRALVGRRVKAVRRHGKHLWLELDRRPWPCLHFGMTGGIHIPTGRAVRLVSDGAVDRPDWPPRFTKLHLRFAGGGELALADGRRLGRIRLRQDPPTEPPISALGFDAWRALPTPVRFHAMPGGRKSHGRLGALGAALRYTPPSFPPEKGAPHERGCRRRQLPHPARQVPSR